MKDMFNMMKKAQEMQKKMGEVQKELETLTVEGSAQGMVSVTMTGTHQVKAVTISPDAVDVADMAMLEDLVAVACNDALGKANALAQEKMKAVTGGLQIPGM